MSNEKVTDLPAVLNAQLSDILYVVQGGISSQETLGQILSLFTSSEILSNPGDPNGSLAGETYQLCWDTSNSKLYICTTTGTSTTAVWTLIALDLESLTDGQLLIGSTGATPVAATLTPGTGINISNGAGSIMIDLSSPVSVTNGGTGNTTFTAYSVVCAGTTATGAFQNVSGVGSSGQILTSNGAAALPTWENATAATGVALTRVDDTNVTLTLGGTPATALLEATSITAGWAGQLSVARGGTGLASLTAHYLPIGNGTTALTLLAPNATSGIPLISQGVSADPAYGTSVVAGGGTGNTTFSAYSVVCAGTTATGAFQNVSGVGSSGQVLTSNGAAALPTWENVSGTGTVNSGTANQLSYYATTGTAVSGLTSANNGTLVTSNSGVPSILAGPGTTGNILQSNAAAAPSFSTATYPSTAGTAGSIIISDGTNEITSTSLWPNTVGTVGKIIRSDGTTNAYTTSTFADTYAVNTLLYASGANDVSGLATANSSILATSSTGAPTWVGSLTDGQLLIGSTGATPVAATLTPGTGINISNGAGSITISSSGGGYGWTEVTGTSQNMAVNNGYGANNVALVSLLLPAASVFGDTVKIQGIGAGLFRITQGAGQQIRLGSSATTLGAGGSLTATNQYDSIELICIVANTTWATLTAPQGIFTVV